MVQLAPDASPLSRRLQPKKKKKHVLVPLAWPGHLCVFTLRRQGSLIKVNPVQFKVRRHVLKHVSLMHPLLLLTVSTTSRHISPFANDV